MNKLIQEIIKPILEANPKIKKVIGVYGGRFQPFGPHHKKVYEWLSKQFDDAYITTSNIKKLPRHPMNFKEKVRHMVNMGIPSNKIVMEKSPFVAKNLMSKFDSETTAVVYIFGKKDTGRLGGGKYFQDYKKNKGNIKGHEEHGYYLVAPHMSVSAGGLEVSGTSMRELLGSDKFDDSERQKLFKKMFGYYNKGIYQMMTNKFKKLFESEINVIPYSKSRKKPVDPKLFDKKKKDLLKGWLEEDWFKKGSKEDRALKLKIAKLYTKAFKQMPGSPNQEKIKKEIEKLRNQLSEAFTIPIEIGDTVLMGKFKNKKVVVKTIDINEKGDIVINGKSASKFRMVKKPNIFDENITFSKDWWKKNLLNEGGAYGHMAHPFDDKDLTFGDLKKIIESGLGGTLSREDNVTEKLDGQNIMVSWKDGKLIAARNKGHIKNGGKTALTTKGIASKFAGRGDIADAFNFAMKDLEKSIGSLSDKQKNKIFNNGYNFMNLEVMWPKSSNVIDYDKAELVFHGALVYDDKGNVKGEVKGSARILAGMIQQVNQHIGKKYSIGKPVFLTVPKHQDFGKMKAKFLGRLNKLQSKFGMKDSDELALYHQYWWASFIKSKNKKISGKVLEGLIKRWAFFDKSYAIKNIKKDIKDESFLEWVLSFDKNDHSKQVKENMKPFETLFFEVGAEILKNVQGFMAANPDKAVQGIRNKLSAAIADVKKGGDLKKLNKLKAQLEKFEAIGGVNAIVPSEGIVFKYQGKTYKFTGAFAPVNQITGLVSF